MYVCTYIASWLFCIAFCSVIQDTVSYSIPWECTVCTHVGTVWSCWATVIWSGCKMLISWYNVLLIVFTVPWPIPFSVECFPTVSRNFPSTPYCVVLLGKGSLMFRASSIKFSSKANMGKLYTICSLNETCLQYMCYKFVKDKDRH